MSDLWYGTSGPHNAPIVLVGEAWGSEEASAKRPFVGTSGNELTRILAEAGLDRNQLLLTNVVAAQPPSNEMWRFFHAAKDAPPSSLTRGLHPTEFVSNELRRLHDQINAFPRRLVIACGNYALWALTSVTGAATAADTEGRRVPSGISSWRGSLWHATEVSSSRGIKLLPIVHPAAILRQWSLRAVTVHDLKARVPQALRDDWRHNPPPVFYAPPTFEQAIARLRSWLARAQAGNSFRLVVDIETKSSLITCVGFADSPNFAMAIPFVSNANGTGLHSFWTPEQEAELLRLIAEVLVAPGILIEGQNFIYDTQYFQHWLAVTPRLDFDTMLAQNVLFPGTPKGLDYLSSLYCRYHWYWKEDGKEWDGKGTIEDLLLYNCWDVVRTYECATTLRALIARFEQDEQWALKMKVNSLCLRMMNRGVLVDKQRASSASRELYEALQGVYAELETIIPQSLVGDSKTPWYRSAQQTNHLFYNVLGLRGIMNRKTGRPTGGKEALNELPKRHPELVGLFDRLKLARSIDNTAHVLAAPTDPDGRMRCSFNPGGTETHRLSSSKNAFGRGMNLQNLTKGDEDD